MVLPKNIYIGRQIRNNIGSSFEEVKLLRQAVLNLYILLDMNTKFTQEQKNLAKSELDNLYEFSSSIDTLKQQYSLQHEELIVEEQRKRDELEAKKLAVEQAKLELKQKQEQYALKYQELLDAGIDEETTSVQAYNDVYSE